MRLMAAEVQVDVDGGVMVVTVNRPQARNAITQPVAEAIAAAFDELDASGELMAGVLTGAGGTFCSGRDLKAALAGDHPGWPGAGRRDGRVRVGQAADRRGEGYALGATRDRAADLVVPPLGRFGLRGRRTDRRRGRPRLRCLRVSRSTSPWNSRGPRAVTAEARAAG